ncbi:MAG: phage tail domain-containing protein [Bacillota bacterium]
MDVLIEKLNGEQVRFSEIGLIPRDFLVSTASVREYKSEITGRPGTIDKGADYGPRTITVPFMFESEDLMRYPKKRDEVFFWLGGKEEYWIYEGRSHGYVDFEAPGETQESKPVFFESEIIYSKRYLVRRTSNLAPDQTGTWGLDSIAFETTELPFAESPETTLVESNGYVYTFSNPATIQVYNGGTETVDPEEGMHLVIKYVGASTDLTIRNQTNGTEWSYTGSSATGNEIKIDGIHSELNSLSIVRNTNLEVIKLEPGWNTIEVTGATNGTLSFDFRWYFR